MSAALEAAESALLDGVTATVRASLAWARALLLEIRPAGVTVPPEDAYVGLVTKETAARALSVSVSTIDRFVREGAPHHLVGGRKRFDTGELLAWSNARGQRAANAKSKKDTTDVDDVLLGSRLRLVAGCR